MERHNESIGSMLSRYYNWSVWEYEKAKCGDRFYMVRVGEGNTGVVMSGVFDSHPYEAADWSGKGRRTFYMDMDCGSDSHRYAHLAFFQTKKTKQTIPSRMVPRKVTHTTVVRQSFSRLFSGISSTIFWDLNGKRSCSTTQATKIMIST